MSNLIAENEEYILKYLFICKKCGATNESDIENGTQDLHCKACGEKLTWEDSFPPLNVQDFILGAQELLETIKNRDKINLEFQHKLLSDDGYEIDLQTLDHFRDRYEKIHERYIDNDDSLWSIMLDGFEDYACKNLGKDTGIAVLSSMTVASKNRLRKPFIIIVAAIIEQLYNNYFEDVIFSKLNKKEAEKILQEYSTAGISKSIEYIKKEINIPLHKIMDNYSNGFYNRWANIRDLRNKIIHRNSIFVSRRMILKLNKLINESLIVFSSLKSSIYHEGL